MRVVGGKDYYDGVTGFDTDETRVFVRTAFNKAEHRPFEKRYLMGKDPFVLAATTTGERYSSTHADIDMIKVNFCGNTYTGAARIEKIWDIEHQRYRYEFKSFWTPDALMAELERQKCKLYTNANRWAPPGDTEPSYYVTDATIADFFAPVPTPKAALDVMIAENVVHSIRHGTASTTGRGRTDYHRWYDNTDGLKHIGFASVIDPWQTYQQIDMWLGSQLAKEEDNMVRLADKELITKHGFDKTSFRNTHHVGKPRGAK